MFYFKICLFLLQTVWVLSSSAEETTATADLVDFDDDYEISQTTDRLALEFGPEVQLEKIQDQVQEVQDSDEEKEESEGIARKEEEKEDKPIFIPRKLSTDDLSSIVAAFNESENDIVVDDLQEDLNHWLAPYFIRKNYPYYLAGHDEDGRPIIMVELGTFDLRYITEKGGDLQVAFEKYARQSMFRVGQFIANASTPERPVDEALYLVDFEGWDLHQVSYLPNTALLMKLALEHRKFIVNHLAATVIVNANFLVENLIRVLRPVFGPAMAKVEVYGSNKAKWIPVVRRVFGSANLPEWYGGNNTDYKPIQVFG